MADEFDVFDVIVIGAGPGGYVCAIRAAQLGFKVACIDKRGTPGGTCLNVGCIPSKALLHASHMFSSMHDAEAMGIHAPSLKLDIGKLMAYKQNGIDGNVDGVRFLLKKNKVAEIIGTARLLSTKQGMTEIEVRAGNDTQIMRAKHVVLATGSQVAHLAGVDIDEENIVSSVGALAFDHVPKQLAIIGAGIIGLELGSVWQRLGAQVTVIEYLDRIAPGLDGEMAKQFQRILAKQGIKFKLGQKVVAAKSLKSSVRVMLESVAAGTPEELRADKVLVAIGRKPYSADLGLEALGITRDKSGCIEVDAHFQTKIAGIYAIGDVIKGAMLAHKAEDEGVALAEHLAGKAAHIDYNIIPSVIYTAPEIAWVGRNEEELKQDGIAYRVGKFPFMANGRAKVNHTTDGFVKILADAKTDMILGAHIIGAQAGDLIGELVMAMAFSASAEDVARTCHAHPTLSEALKEAALAVEGRSLHM